MHQDLSTAGNPLPADLMPGIPEPAATLAAYQSRKDPGAEQHTLNSPRDEGM